MRSERLQWIHDLAERLRGAPLARCQTDEMRVLLDRLDALMLGLSKPLRIAILGEVKAGKSSLINALVGADVPTDVLEVNSVVTVLRHGSGHGSIHYLDGTTDTGDVEQIVATLQDHKDDLDFAERTSHVELAIPLGRLTGLQLLDTPGLGAASKLPMKTMERLADYDVVVWVFNATRQGASRPLEEFRRLGTLGKPILAVVNRVDEVPASELDRLLVKFERDLDVYADVVIALSAKRAVAGAEAELDELNSHLQQYAHEPDKAKLDASVRQFRALAEAVAHLHLGAAVLAEQQGAHLDAFQDRIERAGAHVLQEVDDAVDRWIQDEFLQAQYSELRRAAGEGREQLESALRTTLGPEVMEQEVARLVEHVREQLNDAWSREGTAIGSEWRGIGAQADALVGHHLEQAEALLSGQDIGAGTATGEVLMHGGMGVAAGAGIAAYAALIGPAASTIFIGGALLTFVPPLLIAGLAAGLFKAWVEKRTETSERQEFVRDEIVKLRDDLKKRLWKKQLRLGIEELIRRMTAELRLTAPSRLLPGPSASAPELRAFAEELRAELRASIGR